MPHRPTWFVSFVAAVALQCSACSLLDPTHGMTEEQKVAYHAEQDARKERDRVARAEFEARNVKDLDTQGDGHEEQRDASLVGRYECSIDIPVGEHDFLLVKRDAKYRKHKRLQLFANGSFVEQMLHDVFESTNGDGTTQGFTEEQWKRGMWKTNGAEIWIRTLVVGGMTDWQQLGNYKLATDGGRKLLVVGKLPQNVLEDMLTPRNEEGQIEDISKIDLWAAN